MYNNFSSKKTKKVISALLASALVVTSGPITADAATAKVVGIKKSITVSASATNKVTGLSKAEKKIVKVTKKGKKFTIKGLKAGKATFKIGKKSYTVKVGATTVKAAKTKLTLTKGKAATLKFTTKSGNGDTLTFKASNKNVTLAKKSAKIAKSAASVKATAKKAGKTTITATSKATGKKATVTVTVKNAAKPATTTPGASNTPVATATGSATNTPEATATATATATASGSATNTPDVTATPVATATATPVATGSATNTPEATEVPTEAPTKAPEVVTGGTITVTTNVSGASVKVSSGDAVYANEVAENDTVVTGVVTNGAVTVTVSKDGYETETKTVVVDGNTTVNIELKKVVALDVESVDVVNISQVKVKFNKEVNASAAETTSVYEIKDANLATVQIDEAKLLDDKQTVLLTVGTSSAPTSFDGSKTYTVSVKKDIQTSDAETLATALTSPKFVVTDATLPAVTDVTTYGNKKIVVTFNKPVLLNSTKTDTFAMMKNDNNYVAGYDFDGTAFSSVSYVAGTGYTQVSIEVATVMPVGSYNLKIYGSATNVRDAQGLKLAETVKTVTVKEATSVAQVKEIKVNGRTSVDVVFDGPVAQPAGTTLSWGTGKTADSAVLLSDNCTVRYTFTTNIIDAGEQTFTIDGVKDAYDNTVPKKAVTATVKAENVATATVTVKSDKKIEVSFSKKMYQTGTTGYSVNNLANYTLKNAKGETQTITSVTYEENTAAKSYKATLEFASPLEAGKYTISVKGIKDLVDTQMEAVEDLAITIVDTTRPTLAGVTANGGTNKFIVYFTEAMATTGEHSIADVKNYMIDFDGTGTTYSPEALPTGTSAVAAADGKSVVFTLPAAYASDATGSKKLVPGTSKILIGRDDNGTLHTVADAAGNIQAILPSTTANDFVIATESIPTIASANLSIVDANTIKVPVTNKIDTLVAGDFKYSVNGKVNWKAVSGATLDTDSDGKQYVLLTVGDTFSSTTDLSSIYVKTAASTSSKAAFGRALAANAETSYAKTTSFKTSIKSVQIIDSTHLRLVMDGIADDDSAYAGLKAELLVYQNDTKVNISAIAGKVTTTGKSDSDLTVTLASQIDVTKDVVVKTTPQSLLTGKDANGNYYVANTTGVTAKALSSLLAKSLTHKISGGSSDATVIANGDTINITYSMVLDTTAIKSGWNGAETAATLAVNENGELTVSGYNFGKITGFIPTVAENIDGKIAYDSATGTLTITVDDNDIAATISDNGLTYVPAATIKTVDGNVAIDTTYQPQIADALAPTVVTTKTTKVAAAGNVTANAEYKLVFSEELSTASKLALVNAVENKITTSGTSSVATSWNGAGTELTITLTYGDRAIVVEALSQNTITVTDVAGKESGDILLAIQASQS